MAQLGSLGSSDIVRPVELSLGETLPRQSQTTSSSSGSRLEQKKPDIKPAVAISDGSDQDADALCYRCRKELWGRAQYKKYCKVCPQGPFCSIICQRWHVKEAHNCSRPLIIASSLETSRLILAPAAGAPARDQSVPLDRPLSSEPCQAPAADAAPTSNLSKKQMEQFSIALSRRSC